MFLPCAHASCNTCLGDIAKKADKKVCPECRHPIPRNYVAAIKRINSIPPVNRRVASVRNPAPINPPAPPVIPPAVNQNNKDLERRACAVLCGACILGCSAYFGLSAYAHLSLNRSCEVEWDNMPNHWQPNLNSLHGYNYNALFQKYAIVKEDAYFLAPYLVNKCISSLTRSLDTNTLTQILDSFQGPKDESMEEQVAPCNLLNQTEQQNTAIFDHAARFTSKQSYLHCFVASRLKPLLDWQNKQHQLAIQKLRSQYYCSNMNPKDYHCLTLQRSKNKAQTDYTSSGKNFASIQKYIDTSKSLDRQQMESNCDVRHKRHLLFLQGYQPGFPGLKDGQSLAQEHCPIFLQASPKEHKIMDTTQACSKITTLEKASRQHHAAMLGSFSREFSSERHAKEYKDTMRLSRERHALNMAEIALAKEYCGCIEDEKKM